MTEPDYEKLWAKLEQIDSKTDKIYQGLYGVPGTDDKGMCGQLKAVEEGHATLNRNFWVLVALLVGLGIIGGGVWGLIAH